MTSATITIPEAALLLGVSRNTAYAEAQSGDLAGVPVIKVGRRLLLSRARLFDVLGIESEEESVDAR